MNQTFTIHSLLTNPSESIDEMIAAWISLDEALLDQPSTTDSTIDFLLNYSRALDVIQTQQAGEVSYFRN
jgi:hypothetical protein